MKQRRTRYQLVVLAAVVLSHAGVAIFLINLRVPPRPERNEYVSLLWLPENKPREVSVPPAPHAAAKRPSQKTPPTPSLPAPSSVAEQSDSQPSIDWAVEAAREADTLTSNAITLPKSSDKTPPRPAPSPFAPAPTHHAGDSYRNEVGETIVWVSDKCYQVSGQMLTVPDVMAHAMLPRTVCPRLSNKPRGDLFKDFPAYKKLHPDDDGR